VPVGEYQITAMLSGFKPITKSGVQVNAGLNIRVDVALEVGALSETIQVEAATTLVDTSVIGRTLRAEQIAETPLSGRRASQVAQLRRVSSGEAWAASVPQGVGTFATGVTSINGGRADEFMTTIDGAPSIRVRAAGGFMMGAQNFDTVAEVQVLTTNYQAEYGRSSAGQLRLVTKSGTQNFRGNVFWSHQDDALDSKPGRARRPVSRSRRTITTRTGSRSVDRSTSRRIQLESPVTVLLLGPGVQRDTHRRRADRHRADTRDANGDFSALLPGRGDSPILLTGQPFEGETSSRPNRISPQGKGPESTRLQLPIPGFQQGANNWNGEPRGPYNNQRKRQHQGRRLCRR
jgi:hypothetical protein